jgi:RimJ/RimL family protein N-acetyltransferase
MWKVDEFWAGYFGCSPEDLHEPRTLVLPHAALVGYDDVLAFRHGPACIVSVPESVPQREREKLRDAPPDRAFDPDVLAKSFEVWREQVSAPAWLGLCGPTGFRPASSSARILGEGDSDALGGLAETSGEAAWSASEFRLRRDPVFGLFHEEELVACSGYVDMDGVLACVRILVHPRHSGKGCAKAAASAAMEHAFGRDLVPLWRAPASNEAAIAVARSLGFRCHAFTIDVRLAANEF